MDIASIRKDYSLRSLDIRDVDANPITQFKSWFNEALDAEVLEANAMHLSTLSLDGFPNGRIVLLKEVDHGFVFFTNYTSQKGKEIHTNAKASLTFFWPELERQVRIMGEIKKVSPKESDDYFFSRPLASQIGAWTSPQSQVISSRTFLDENKWITYPAMMVLFVIFSLILGRLDTKFGFRKEEMRNSSTENPVLMEILDLVKKNETTEKSKK